MVSSTTLSDHLRHHASQYFGGADGARVHVQLRRTNRRINSTLHEFVVNVGENEHRVLVKQPSTLHLSSRSGLPAHDRPRLFPKALPEWKSRFEFRAMSAIERHVARLDDPRFAAVRVLDLLPDQHSLVLEKVGEQSLGRQLPRASLISAGPAARQCLDRTVRNSGAWLRRYHELPALEHTRPRGASRTVFVDALVRFTEYLARATGEASLERLGRELVERAEAVLPAVLPLGLGHGDYAPRNVLAGPTGQIRIIDTQARWQAPVYEDISHFLTAIKASPMQIMSRGLACRARFAAHLERQFLAGYFEDASIPLDRIRLFECQTLVERWAGLVHRSQESRGWKRLAKGGRAVWSKGFLQKLVDQLLAEVRTASSVTPLHASEIGR